LFQEPPRRTRSLQKDHSRKEAQKAQKQNQELLARSLRLLRLFAASSSMAVGSQTSKRTLLDSESLRSEINMVSPELLQKKRNHCSFGFVSVCFRVVLWLILAVVLYGQDSPPAAKQAR
jgi:hypothetical protein